MKYEIESLGLEEHFDGFIVIDISAAEADLALLQKTIDIFEVPGIRQEIERYDLP
jgi:hypothetical protein